MLKDYLLYNWALILVLIAFSISLLTTVFLDKKTIRRYSILIIFTFVLSIGVFVEFYLANLKADAFTEEAFKIVVLSRKILMALRYSATPVIVALFMYTIIRKLSWVVFIPSGIFFIINVISIFNGIVFQIDAANEFTRGALGSLPFVGAGGYCFVLINILIQRSNKKPMEIVQIVFLTLALASGVVLPFVIGSDFSRLFCTIIAIALFSYYEFSILLQTKKDSLTGLLNRQAYYSDITKDRSKITALVLIDVNGLKNINDKLGHAAGDDALVSLAVCIKKSLKFNQTGYRIGGDEFVIICWKDYESDVQELIDRFKKNVLATDYRCSTGYSYDGSNSKKIEDMLKEADAMMYVEKKAFYLESGKERRR